MAIEWVTCTEFARRHNITLAYTTKICNQGQIRTNGKTGRDRRIDASSQLPGDISGRGKGAEKKIKKSLTDVRAEKVAKEVELLDQKLLETRRKMMRDACDIFHTAFKIGFAPFKQRLMGLKLDKEQNEKLQELFDECLREMAREIDREMNDETDNGE